MKVFATLSLLFASVPTLAAAEKENRVVYYVYFSDDKCEVDTAGIIGKVAGEKFLGVGGMSETGRCAEEVVCLMDADSELCQSLTRTNSGNGHLDVDEFGVVVECE